MLLPLHSYRVDSASSARLLNCYAEAAPKEAKGPIILHRAPGIASFCAAGTGPGRGLHTANGRLYAVSGSKVYRITPEAEAVELGTIDGSGRVYSADNNSQLVLVTENGGYVVSGDAVATISDADFRPAGPCAFIDNYIVFVERSSGRFFCSALADATDYDALDFATAEGGPDNLITLAVDHRQVVLVGENSTELWDNIGGSGFPFSRSPNGFIELGGIAPRAITKQDQSAYILAQDRTVRRLQGMTWLRVSQHGVERAIRSYARVDDCEASAYSIDGHLCTVWRFPSAGATWVYNATTGEWHERDSFPDYEDWDVSAIAEAYGKTFVQRASTGEIGVLSAETYAEWGNAIRTSWTYQSLYGSGQRIGVSRLELGIRTGVGLTTGQGSDPRLTLEISRDGGVSFPITMPTRSFGAQGKYTQRVHWDRLGAGFDNVFRVSTADPVPLTVWDSVVS